MAGTGNNSNKPNSNQPKARPRRNDAEFEGSSLFSMMGIRANLIHSTFMKVVLGILIAIFAVSFLFTSRSPTAGINGGPPGSGGPDPVASAAGTDITRDSLLRSLGQQMQQAQMFGQKIGPDQFLASKQSALGSLVENAAESAAANAAGITVSDAEIDAECNKQIDDQIKQEKGTDEAAFRRRIEAQYPHGESDYRDAMMKNIDRDAVRQSVLLKKYEASVKAANKIDEADYKRSVTKLNLRQIVLRPAVPGPKEDYQSASAKNALAARQRGDQLMAQLRGKSGATLSQAFDALARKSSDDSATKGKGGALGYKLPSELPVDPAVRDALAAATTPLVGPLQGEGIKDVYIFLIEGSKVELPKNYAAKKATFIKDFKTQRDNEVWSKKQEELRKSVTPDIYDPALVAYKMQTQEIPALPAGAAGAPNSETAAKTEEAIAKYQEALGYASPLEEAAIRYQLAQLFEQEKQLPKAIETLQAAVKAGGPGEDPVIQIALARELTQAKQPKAAILALDRAAKELDANPSQPSMFGGGNPDDQLRLQIAAGYDQVGETKSALAQRKKIAPPSQNGMGGMGGMGGGMSFPGQ